MMFVILSLIQNKGAHGNSCLEEVRLSSEPLLLKPGDDEDRELIMLPSEWMGMFNIFS